MRFVLVTTGSLGDVKPFVALARGLQGAGHAVRLAGPEDCQELCEKYGVDFYPIDQDHQRRLHSQAGTRLQEGNTVRFGIGRVADKRRIFAEVNRAAWQACQGAEAIVYRIGGYLAVDSIAERLGVACFKAGLVPYTPTREFPSLYLYRGNGYGRAGNRLSYLVGEQAVWQFFRQSINAFRQDDLGLKPYPLLGPGAGDFTSRLPMLYGFSPAILPRPTDWPKLVQITGHWDLDEAEDWQPPAGLVEFLQAGPPPVYIGFGSMVSQYPQQTYDLVLEALRICGQRAVLASSWGGVQGRQVEAGRIYEVDGAPHAWLFPRMAAAVHHGGIGTTTANLKAGIPAVIVPFNYDQPLWGAVVKSLGVGPAPIPRKNLTSENLAKAIQISLENEIMRGKATAISRKIRDEDGVQRAVALINEAIIVVK